jgi:endonuclease/exonuclease/phosphatase family metal-dependent hydrolase
MPFHRRLVLALLLPPALLLLGGAPPTSRVSDAKAGAGTRLRVLTYNIHHGEGADGKFDLERIAKLINSLEPDLVAIQEVDVKTRRSSGVDQAAELARLTRLHPFFARIIDYQGGPYGLMILTRGKPLKMASHPIPYHPNEEPRVLAEARVQLGDDGPEVAFFNTHLDYRTQEMRVKQVERINQLMTDVRPPLVILAGDLNSEPDSPPMRQLLKSWRDATPADALSYPSDKPVKKIDYVLYRPSPNLKLVESRVIEERVASDHRPVLAVFEVEK